MEKILITGGAGFIGSHVAECLLREGKRLAIVDNLDDFYAAEGKRRNLEVVRASGEFQYFPVDIREGAALREVFASFQPEGVIHLAARPGVRLSFEQPERYTSINVAGTVQVLEACRLHGVQRLIFASSSSVYGSTGQAPFREDAIITHPLSVYAATKVAGEAMAFTYSHAYSLPVICLRFFTVYGPRQRPDLAIRKFAEMILAGKEITLFGDGSLERDFTYIDDIVDGVRRALDITAQFEVFNLGNSHPIRVDDLVALLGQALSKPVRRKYVPTPPGEMLLTHADVAKAHSALGYSPKVNIQEGIYRFADWLKSRT